MPLLPVDTTTGRIVTQGITCMPAGHQWQGLFYGWIIVVASLIIVALSAGLMFFSGVFMEPLEHALQWRREQSGAPASTIGWHLA
ncbi:hypothetical protein NKDENANG_02474 [Candidatus Entotheonellaceae bacterium PAL068K]